MSMDKESIKIKCHPTLTVTSVTRGSDIKCHYHQSFEPFSCILCLAVYNLRYTRILNLPKLKQKVIFLVKQFKF